MTKDLITQTHSLDWNDGNLIATMRHTVAGGLSDAEFLLFAEHCKATKLNPFKREVWAIKAGGRLQIMTGINGFLAIANAHPQYDGMEVEVDFDEAPTKAICKVYRKDRKFPAVGVAMLQEYRKDTPIWKQMPRVMLTKVAKSIAIREAFPQELNGLYTEEEMPSQYAASRSATEKVMNAIAEDVPVTLVHEEIEAATDAVLYDLTTLPDEKESAARELLLKAGARQPDHEQPLKWKSPIRINKLSKYEVQQ